MFSIAANNNTLQGCGLGFFTGKGFIWLTVASTKKSIIWPITGKGLHGNSPVIKFVTDPF